MRTRDKVELSVQALYRLLRQENLGEPHALFTGGERYYSPRFRQEDDARLRQELDAAGVTTAQGLDQRFVELLTVMQRAGVEYYGWLYDGEGPYSVLAAGLGRVAMLAERVGDKVAFEWIDSARVLESFVFRLPNVAAARGEAISVRLSDLGGHDGEGFRLHRPQAARPPAVRRLEGLMRAARLGGGKLYTAKRDAHGKRVRARDWVDAVDLQEGRWAVYRTRGRGEPFVTAAPGTPQLIARQLGALQGSLG